MTGRHGQDAFQLSSFPGQLTAWDDAPNSLFLMMKSAKWSFQAPKMGFRIQILTF